MAYRFISRQRAEVRQSSREAPSGPEQSDTLLASGVILKKYGRDVSLLNISQTPMNKEMMKKNVHAHVLLQPPACRLDENGFEVPASVDDDWWLIQSITDEGVTISDPRTGHVRLLGYDHIHKFTSDGVKDGAKRGFLTLTVQLYVQARDVRVMPTRPGERLPPKQPKVVERTVEISYPNVTGMQARLSTQGYQLGWARQERVQTLVDVEGHEVVLEPYPDGSLSRFRTYDGLVLPKRRI
jgi:hypothetical protein